MIVVSGDPVADGVIDSLARPGGNITGLTNISPQLAGKRLELLKDAVPEASTVAYSDRLIIWIGKSFNLPHSSWESGFTRFRSKKLMRLISPSKPQCRTF